METFELILLLLCAVIISSVVEKMLPRISIPLVQIGSGVIIALLASNTTIVTLNPEFFLILFIAPLLYHEARISDKYGLWQNKKVILSLAIGLVIAIILSVGFCVNFLIPTIPLAAAFALGAALGPTDAVAVSSLSETAHLDRDVSARLSGEALLNDASGVVGFQFAVAAACTGSFSLLHGVMDFSIEFFGGLVLGIILGGLSCGIFKIVDHFDMGSNVFYVLFDITMPFIVYILSMLLHVSGILAVVSSGIIISLINTRKISPRQSSLNIVTDNVWKVISFTLNGIVFVLLGMQIPKAMSRPWDDAQINNLSLIGYVVVITIILVAVRFIWLCVMDAISKNKETGKRNGITKKIAKSALIATIGGPKGAVTLSVIFSIPLFAAENTPFPERELIIFLASGTILLTLALANFVLPILAPSAEEDNAEWDEKEAQAKVEILRNVIDRVNAMKNVKNFQAVTSVAGGYMSRLERHQNAHDLESETTKQLRLDVARHLQAFTVQQLDEGMSDPMAGYIYLHKLTQTIGYLKHHSESRWWFLYALRHGSTTIMVGKRYIRRLFERSLSDNGKSNLTELQIEAEKEAIRYLNSLVDNPDSPYPPEVVSSVTKRYQRTLKSLLSKGPNVTAFTKSIDAMDDIQRQAYQFELEEIRLALDSNKIRRSKAVEMRDSVYLMLIDLDTNLA